MFGDWNTCTATQALCTASSSANTGAELRHGVVTILGRVGQRLEERDEIRDVGR